MITIYFRRILLNWFFFGKNNYLIILNLETPLKSNTPIRKWINLYNSKRLIDVLKTLNVVAVNVAKNHNMVWGKSGLEGLLSDLKKKGIIYYHSKYFNKLYANFLTKYLSIKRIIECQYNFNK